MVTVRWNGDWLTYLVNQSGMQKQEVAHAANMARATFSLYCNNKAVPSLDVLTRIFNALGMTASEAQAAVGELFSVVEVKGNE
jgi:transcriptional regulator with XRE-family HTH domain